MKQKTRVLYIDIEGGWGGSSRSLYFLIKNLGRRDFEPVVVYGKKGPNNRRYAEIDVVSYCFSPIPRTTAMRCGNLKSIAVFSLKLLHLPRFLFFVNKLFRKYDFDIVHLNHESLFFIAIFFRIFFKVPIVTHIRTMLPENLAAKLQCRITCRTSDYLIFISENERNLWLSLYGDLGLLRQSVIYNPAGNLRSDKEVSDEFDKALKDKFAVAVVSSISNYRGTDYLLDIANIMRERRKTGVIFVVIGKINPKDKYAGALMGRIKSEGLEPYFLFTGYKENTLPWLEKCDILLHVCRMVHNPWGRDIIEAMSAGKPVVSVGTYGKFVENGVNGFLVAGYKPHQITDKILSLSADPDECTAIGRRNSEKAKKLFDSARYSKKIEEIYAGLLGSR